MRNQCLVYLIILLVLPARYTEAQAWEWLNPHPQGKDLYTIHASWGGTVYTGGSQGMLLKSSTGGSSWELLATAPGAIRGIATLANGSVLLVGEGGLVMRSIDGVNFSALSSGTQADCNAIAISGSTGIIATGNGSVLLSTNAGEAWQTEATGLQGALATAFITPAGTLLAAGYNGTIARKPLGGAWSRLPIASAEIITAISGYSTTLYAVTSGGGVYYSNNDGATWVLRYRANGWLTGIACAHRDSATATGINGLLLRTSDAGLSWNAYGTGSATDWFGCSASPEGSVYICGERGALAVNQASGGNWTILSDGETGDIRYLQFLDLNTGWAVGDRGLLLRTTDGGETWAKISSGTVNALNCISFYKNWGVVAGDNGTLLQSKDSGKTWTDVSGKLNVSGDLYTVYADYFNSRITGAEGLLFESYNQGGQWNKISLSWQLNFRSFSALNIRIGMLVGDGGRIYRAYRWFGSTIYEPLNTDPAYDLRSVHAINDKMVWAVGRHGVVLRTTFGGWFTVMTHLNAEWLNAVYFLDSLHGYCAGSEGKVFKSTDGGVSWRQLATGITNSLTGVFFKNADNGWVTGAGGTILRTRSGGQEPLEVSNTSAVAGNEQLVCYPNPADAVVKLRLPLGAEAGTPVCLYNLLGELVRVQAVPANPGATVLLTTAGLPEGVYIARAGGSTAKVIIRHR